MNLIHLPAILICASLGGVNPPQALGPDVAASLEAAIPPTLRSQLGPLSSAVQAEAAKLSDAASPPEATPDGPEATVPAKGEAAQAAPDEPAKTPKPAPVVSKPRSTPRRCSRR